MSNVRMFDVRHSNDECQNFMNVKLFDVRHSNVEFQNDTNVKSQTAGHLTTPSSRIKFRANQNESQGSFQSQSHKKC